MEIDLKDEDVHLITYALRKLHNTANFFSIKQNSAKLIEYIENEYSAKKNANDSETDRVPGSTTTTH